MFCQYIFISIDNVNAIVYYQLLKLAMMYYYYPVI